MPYLRHLKNKLYTNDKLVNEACRSPLTSNTAAVGVDQMHTNRSGT